MEKDGGWNGFLCDNPARHNAPGIAQSRTGRDATAFNLSESADQIPVPFKRSKDFYGKPALEGGVPLTRHRRIKSYDLSAS
jgi:hypothetical protein